ncbi:hypothetical protein [Commensalibacter communis]|uniref:hypothetical protein n=1 Tax=Commensalibacter communis TaxID=2972786 RepID=UPI0022FF9AB5|nr:hypothetical protein [Commensalibacter communis]CAI3951397.1 unnamed protein product [Commensalibacter communis]CAI3956881.1 unnamed protein product [Commensalibacter communis]
MTQNTRLNSPIEIIIAYVEGTLSSSEFINELYHNPDLEKLLSEPIHIALYIDQIGTLYLYLLSLNLNHAGGILDATHTLSLYLTKKGISFNQSQTRESHFDLYLKIQPKWLQIPESYFQKLLADTPGKTEKELELALKQKIKEHFQFLKKPPRWLQDTFWPVENNKPLIFIDQLSISPLFHDETQLYIFYNEDNNSFITIKQSI